jgi:hypothetical protein
MHLRPGRKTKRGRSWVVMFTRFSGHRNGSAGCSEQEVFDEENTAEGVQPGVPRGSDAADPGGDETDSRAREGAGGACGDAPQLAARCADRRVRRRGACDAERGGGEPRAPARERALEGGARDPKKRFFREFRGRPRGF